MAKHDDPNSDPMYLPNRVNVSHATLTIGEVKDKAIVILTFGLPDSDEMVMIGVDEASADLISDKLKRHAALAREYAR